MNRARGVILGIALCLTAGHVFAGTFEDDVNAAIDDGLDYSRANNHFAVNTSTNGLTLLTLLEKENIPAGYAGLDAADKLRAENAACVLIDSGTFGDRASFYSYGDGQVMMALSVYLATGGPDEPTAGAGHACAGRSARATINKVVDRSIAAQTAVGPCSGFWGYGGGGCDSSTTQLTVAGLSAAKGFYSSEGESLDMDRTPGIVTTLDRTSTGYSGGKISVGGLFDSCGPDDCLGHGYQATYVGSQNSSQQTASGTWGQLVGSGKTVNDPSIQGYLRWLQNAYSYNTLNYPVGWARSYFYFFWSSSKTYNIIEASGVAPAAGNITPSDIGSLPALTVAPYTRTVNRDPAVDTRPAVRGAGGAGYYAGAPTGWYYDYGYRLMSLQLADGRFSSPIGSWNFNSSHSYALLVLQRSLGGACADSDGDGVCDNVDNCPADPNADQSDRDDDSVGDVCDNCPDVPNPGQEDSVGDGIGDACRGVADICDYDGDGDVDRRDVKKILRARGTIVAPGDPGDYDGDGLISRYDGRACAIIHAGGTPP